MSGFGTEKDQDRRRKRLKALLQLPCNRTCCDCNQRQPQWASINLGLFFCIRCSGIHRNLGVHISVVRSITLDSWKEDWVNMLEQVGNERGNAFWEQRPPGPRKPDERATDHQLEQYIRDKYVRGTWRGPESEAPHLTPAPASASNLPQQSLTSPTPSVSSNQSTNSQRLQPNNNFTSQSPAQHNPAQLQRTATDQQQGSQSNTTNAAPIRRNNMPQTSLSQTNSAIRHPSAPAQQQQQSHLQQTNPSNPFGRLDSNSNSTQPTTAQKNATPQLDMDFASFFQDDTPKNANNNNNNNSGNFTPNQSTQSQMGSPLGDLFAPSTATNTANNSVNTTPQSAPPPQSNPANDPFALLSQPGAIDTGAKKTNNILNLYNSPTPNQQQNNNMNGMNNMNNNNNSMNSMNNNYNNNMNGNMQSPYGNQQQQQQPMQQMYGSPYGYGQPQQMMYGQGMQMNQNPYAQPQMQHPNSHAAFGGTYSYAAPSQSGLQAKNNQSNNNGQNFDVFAGFM